MSEYCHNSDAHINDVANGVTLRCDVRCCLDRHGFVFFPVGNKEFMTYVIKPTERDFVDMLHRRLVTIPDRVADQFLYARFAYSIIKLPRDPLFAKVALPININVEQIRELRSKRTQEKAGRQMCPALGTYDVLFCIC